MSRLVLIDGNAILHRAFHAMPPLTSNGQPINAVYGFTSMLLKIIEDLIPTHLAVCFDRKEPTFRKVQFEDYQAHRPETDVDLVSQFDLAKKVSKAFGIPVYDKAGFEADDLIGTISKKAKVDEVVIVTGDKDQLQLVDEKIKVYMPIRGLSNAVLMGTREVYGKLGVSPEQIIDLKALIGDPSDNYKGVPGIGPVTAEKLLSKYNSYNGVYKNIDKIDNSTAKKLKDGKESGDISFDLAKIVTDVNFKFDISEMNKWDLGRVEVEKVFDEIGFRTLKSRVQKKVEGDINKTPTKKDLEKVVVFLADKLKRKQYAIRGTMSMFLQGFDMGVDDIDILTDKKTALLFNKIFEKYLQEKVEYKQSDQYRSYFGKFIINRILVEVYGEWQIKDQKSKISPSRELSRAGGKNQTWSKVYNSDIAEVNRIKVDEVEVCVTKPEVELSVFALEGRWNAYHKLKKQIDEKNQRTLF
jgi:5'-3' exonuclease